MRVWRKWFGPGRRELLAEAQLWRERCEKANVAQRAVIGGRGDERG